jgi:hypothetical protein
MTTRFVGPDTPLPQASMHDGRQYDGRQHVIDDSRIGQGGRMR